MNSVYTMCRAEQYHYGHMTKFSSRGVVFPYRSKRSKRITEKKKLHVNVYVCMYVYTLEMLMRSSCTQQSFTFTPIPNYLAVRPLLADPKGALFLRNFTNVTAETSASIPPHTPLLSIGHLANGINPLWPLFLKKMKHSKRAQNIFFIWEVSYMLRNDTYKVKFNKLKTIK